ncbi:hypothetical protein [Wukongibacter sp. M2B1]|uniref:hypothetical protein n=1 Tax=Wukongibacter sp. M2B1 TaxID=3088895 RepID=UPI003D793B65
MKNEHGFSTREKLILETTLKVMYQKNFEAANITNIAEQAMLNPRHVKDIYYSDDSLRMEAIKYSAIVWVEYIKKDIAGEKDKAKKIRKLLHHYAAGSESYPLSLSLYIDVWKKIRDCEGGKEELLKEELKKIYALFVKVFEELLLEEVFIDNAVDSEIRQLAWIMVVISDGLHVQNLIRPKSLNFDRSVDVLYKMINGYLSEMGK